MTAQPYGMTASLRRNISVTAHLSINPTDTNSETLLTSCKIAEVRASLFLHDEKKPTTYFEREGETSAIMFLRPALSLFSLRFPALPKSPSASVTHEPPFPESNMPWTRSPNFITRQANVSVYVARPTSGLNAQ